MTTETEKPRARRRKTASPAEPQNPLVTTLKAHVSQSASDLFEREYGVGNGGLTVIMPPYPIDNLAAMVHGSSALRPCIDAMVQNIDGTGHTLVYVGPEGQEMSAEAAEEKALIESLLDTPSPSVRNRLTLTEIRKRVRADREAIGCGYLEIGRNDAGEIVLINHVPGWSLRATTLDGKEVPVTVEVKRGSRVEKVVVRERFRRYVQVKNGVNKVFFKEFGDPRPIDPKTGLVNPDLPFEEQANEILPFIIPDATSKSVYGLPRWFGAKTAVLGLMEAELTNLEYFLNNAIPALSILVSGGSLTQDTIDNLDRYVRRATGRQAFNEVWLIEAEGSLSAAAPDGSVPTPKLELKSMRDMQNKDALFLEYEGSCGSKVREAFRLPPVLIGKASEYTYATAKVSFDVAEKQIFAPEREEFDRVFNDLILATYKPRFWKFKSNPGTFTDPATIIDALGTFEASGALTPNVVIGMMNALFKMDVELIKEPWGSYPFSLVKELATSGGKMPTGAEIEAAFPSAAEVEGSGDGASKSAIEKVLELRAELRKAALLEAA